MSMQFFSVKDELYGKIDSFLYESLAGASYLVSEMHSSLLLTHNRFDLGLKLAYLSYRETVPDLAREIYHHDIRSQTLGDFVEFGNKDKSSFELYLDSFEMTFSDMQSNGFDYGRTLIPLSTKGTILNGAHRVACAAFLGKNIVCVKTELNEISPDYQYFIDRNVPIDILEMGAIKFCEYARNIYLAFLWPSGRKNYEVTEALFENIVYKKRLKLGARGGVNLLIELYKHMDWIGSREDGFPGAKQKLIECFSDFEEFTVILFQADSLSNVQDIKKRVRDFNGIGYSSIHITDTVEEVCRVSKLIFNRNGLHFLNYADPYKFPSFFNMIESFRSGMGARGEDYVFAGSMILSLYGLREARDIDFYSEMEEPALESLFQAESHDSQLVFEGVEKRDLIYNPRYNFEYAGVVFLSFDQVYKFKKNRNEEKDINDCSMMVSLLGRDRLGFLFAKIRQYFFYRKIILKSKFLGIVIFVLKATGFYGVVRSLYRKLSRSK